MIIPSAKLKPDHIEVCSAELVDDEGVEGRKRDAEGGVLLSFLENPL